MKKIVFLFSVTSLMIFGCIDKNKKNITSTKNINHAWLDSIIKNSDSSYSKPYYRTDFVTAVFYVNKKDSSVCQLMKDSVGSIRQVIIVKHNVRSFFAQYFANGGLQADLPLDAFGQYYGTGKFFYQDGSLQSSGNYNHGFKTGEWKVFDEKGKITNTDFYDNNGNIMPQKAP